MNANPEIKIDDESAARMLHRIVNLIALLTGVAFVLMLIPFSRHHIIIAMGCIPFFFLFIATKWMIPRYGVRVAAIVFVGGMVILQMGTSLAANGPQAQGLVSAANLILISGFVLGAREAIRVSLAICLYIACYVPLTYEGFLPLEGLPVVPAVGAISLIATLITTGGIVAIGLREWTLMLSRERHALNSARETALKLETARNQIEVRGALTSSLVKLSEELTDCASDIESVGVCRTHLHNALQFEHSWILNAEGTVLPDNLYAISAKITLPMPDNAEETTWVGHDEMLCALKRHFDNRIQSSVGVKFVFAGNTQYFLLASHRERSLSSMYVNFFTTAIRLMEGANAKSEMITRKLNHSKLEGLVTLAAGVAHDFNNLLTTILGNIEVVRRPGLSEKARSKHLGDIHASVIRASGLTKKMLGAQQPIEGKETVCVKRLCESLESTFRQIAPSDVEFTMDLQASTAWVQCNAVDIEQILLNLINNAFQAITASGVARLNVLNERGAEGEQCLVLQVQDDGVGIPAHMVSRIFDPFYSTRETRGGHGLGLTSVYALTQSLGGQIDVESTEGVGSTFSVSLPISAPPVEVNLATKVDAELPTLRCVLLVDDDPDVRDIVPLLLSPHVDTVVSVSSGQEALMELQERNQEVDLLITDCQMPGMTGVQLVDEVLASGCQIPMIVVSGNPLHYSGVEKKHGSVGVLAKPFGERELLDALRAVSADSDIRHPLPERKTASL